MKSSDLALLPAWNRKRMGLESPTKPERATRGTGATATRKAKAAEAFNARCHACKVLYREMRDMGIDVVWRTPRKMNGWEAAYRDRLNLLIAAGEALWAEYEAWSMPLAKGAKYCPDFVVMTATGLEFVEVKGHWREAARLRCKIFREKYPQWPLRVVSKRDGKWVAT